MCVGRQSFSKIHTIECNLMHSKSEIINDEPVIQNDILATSTYYTKILFFTLNEWYQNLYNSIFFRILFKTTQPAHLITAIAMIFLSSLFLPNKHIETKPSSLWTLVYLGSFCAHFGAQIWMTFISGLALYFSLPRHTFGSVQQVLFPKYFFLNAALSLITLTVFLKVKHNELQTTEVVVQTIGMMVCFLLELLIRLYLTPPLLSLMTIKNQIEKDAGIGMEIGRLNTEKLVHCTEYIHIHKSFRKVHMSIAIGNIIDRKSVV